MSGYQNRFFVEYCENKKNWSLENISILKAYIRSLCASSVNDLTRRTVFEEIYNKSIIRNWIDLPKDDSFDSLFKFLETNVERQNALIVEYGKLMDEAQRQLSKGAQQNKDDKKLAGHDLIKKLNELADYLEIIENFEGVLSLINESDREWRKKWLADKLVRLLGLDTFLSLDELKNHIERKMAEA